MTTDERPPTRDFSAEEEEALRALRARYAQDHDYFSAHERAQLDFLRWLRETGLAKS